MVFVAQYQQRSPFRISRRWGTGFRDERGGTLERSSRVALFPPRRAACRCHKERINAAEAFDCCRWYVKGESPEIFPWVNGRDEERIAWREREERRGGRARLTEEREPRGDGGRGWSDSGLVKEATEERVLQQLEKRKRREWSGCLICVDMCVYVADERVEGKEQRG